MAMPFKVSADDITIRSAISGIVDSLAGIYDAAEAAAIARLILESLKGWTAVDIAIKGNEPVVSEYIQGKIAKIVDRLLLNEPIQYILGYADFYGLKFKVTPSTLIPRQDTAELVDWIVKENQEKDLRIADLCTGSGCIAIALARNVPFSEVTGFDVSLGALDIARENSQTLKTRVGFENFDVLAEQMLPGAPYDIVVSNPPYIARCEKATMEKNVLEYEPHIALFVPDENPLLFYKAILELADKSLKPGGLLYFEINPRFINELKQQCERSGFCDVELHRATNGQWRFLKCRRLS